MQQTIKELITEWDQNFPGKKRCLDSLKELAKSKLNPKAPEYIPK